MKKSSLMYVKFKSTRVFFIINDVQFQVQDSMPKNSDFFDIFKGVPLLILFKNGHFFQTHVIMKLSNYETQCPRRRLSSLCINLQRECMRLLNRREVVSPQDGITRRAHMLAHAKSAQNEIFRTEFHNYMCLKKVAIFEQNQKGEHL